MTDSPVGEGDFTVTFAGSDRLARQAAERAADTLLALLGEHTWAVTDATTPIGPPVHTIRNDVVSFSALHKAAGRRRSNPWPSFTVRYAHGVLHVDLGEHDPLALTLRPLTAAQEALAERWDRAAWWSLDSAIRNGSYDGPCDGAHYASTGSADLVALALDLWENMPDNSPGFDLRDLGNAMLADDTPDAPVAAIDAGVLSRLLAGWTGTPADLLTAARAVTAPAQV